MAVTPTVNAPNNEAIRRNPDVREVVESLRRQRQMLITHRWLEAGDSVSGSIVDIVGDATQHPAVLDGEEVPVERLLGRGGIGALAPRRPFVGRRERFGLCRMMSLRRNQPSACRASAARRGTPVPLLGVSW